MSTNSEPSRPKLLDLTSDETAALHARLASKLSPEDLELMSGVLDCVLWLNTQLAQAKFTFNRLKKFFGFSTEKKKRSANDEAAGSVDDSSDDASPGDADTDSSTKPPRKSRRSGRFSASDYWGCETQLIPHATLSRGDACPTCVSHADDVTGRLYEVPAGVALRLSGQPMINGIRYELSTLRCGACGTRFRADLPDAIAEQPKYAPSCAAVIAFGHYYQGLPFKRIEASQSYQGVPLADATQWDLMQMLAAQVAPVFDALLSLAAEATVYSMDDTPQSILFDETGERSSQPSHGTVLLAQIDSHVIHVYDIGLRCAGAVISDMLRPRERTDSFCVMSDALTANKPKDLRADLLAKYIVCHCLVHGRRKFYDCLDGFPSEAGYVIDTLAVVYRHEAHCCEQGLSPADRLAYHLAHSAPELAGLRLWLLNHVRYSDKVEKNSPMGRAIQYWLSHWDSLTRFLQVEGAPLDNNVSERAIKYLIRYRKNAYFFKTPRGALIGGQLMTLIATAIANQINPVAYLIALQTHADAVADAPYLWLPWRYQATMDAITDALAEAA